MDGRWKMEDYVFLCWLIQRLNGKKNLPLVYARFGCLCKAFLNNQNRVFGFK
jgi:hypothetical protein